MAIIGWSQADEAQRRPELGGEVLRLMRARGKQSSAVAGEQLHTWLIDNNALVFDSNHPNDVNRAIPIDANHGITMHYDPPDEATIIVLPHGEPDLGADPAKAAFLGSYFMRRCM